MGQVDDCSGVVATGTVEGRCIGIRVSKWNGKQQEDGIQSIQKTPWPAEVG